MYTLKAKRKTIQPHCLVVRSSTLSLDLTIDLQKHTIMHLSLASLGVSQEWYLTMITPPGHPQEHVGNSAFLKKNCPVE